MSDVLVGAIVGGAIGVVTAFITAFIPLIIAGSNRKHEREVAEIAEIDKAAGALVTELAYFRHWVPKDVETAATRPLVQLYADIQGAFYVWEIAVEMRLCGEVRARVEGLRKDIEQTHDPKIQTDKYPGWVATIISLTHTATGRELPK